MTISHDLDSVHYCIWDMMQEHVITSTSPWHGRLVAAAPC